MFKSNALSLQQNPVFVCFWVAAFIGCASAKAEAVGVLGLAEASANRNAMAAGLSQDSASKVRPLLVQFDLDSTEAFNAKCSRQEIFAKAWQKRSSIDEAVFTKYLDDEVAAEKQAAERMSMLVKELSNRLTSTETAAIYRVLQARRETPMSCTSQK